MLETDGACKRLDERRFSRLQGFVELLLAHPDQSSAEADPAMIQLAAGNEAVHGRR